jgi:hypothetical protein
VQIDGAGNSSLAPPACDCYPTFSVATCQPWPWCVSSSPSCLPPTPAGPQVPYFNAPIYLENKTQIGKVEEILGAINNVVRGLREAPRGHMRTAPLAPAAAASGPHPSVDALCPPSLTTSSSASSTMRPASPPSLLTLPPCAAPALSSTSL